MKKKKVKHESKFYSIIKNSCEQKGAFYYKIPDAYGYSPDDGSRFLLPKPYDLIFAYKGFTFHTEVKYIPEFKAFSVKNLRDSQIKSLTEIDNNRSIHTIPLVVLGIYRPREIKRMYFIDYAWLVQNSLLKKHFGEIKKYIDVKSIITSDGKRKDVFDLDNIMDVLIS